MSHLWLAALVVLNEVRYDPPGPDAGGEYVELLNASNTPVLLDERWRLQRGNGARADDWLTVWIGDGSMLDAGMRLVVGDDPRADRAADLALQNGPDACRLRRGDETVDVVGWGTHAFDEYVETSGAIDPPGGHIVRWPDGTDTDDNSSDLRAALIETVGASNSPEHWLTVQPRWPPSNPPHPVPGRRVDLRLHVANAGSDAATASAAGFVVSSGQTELARWAFATSLPAGAARDIDIPIGSPPGGAVVLEIEPWHDASANVGAGFGLNLHAGSSPVVLNEIMADPDAGEPEWIELRHGGGSAAIGWSIRDAAGGETRLPVLGAREYLVVTGDRAALLDQVAVDGLAVVEVDGWITLNDSEELVALVDERGAVRDAFAFSARSGHSAERVHPHLFGDDPAAFSWTRTPSPGRINAVDVPTPKTAVFDISPRVVGEAPVRITFNLGDGTSTGTVRLRLYDTRGVLRGEVYRHAPSRGNGVFVWRGDLDGARVAPGLYVLSGEFTRNDGSVVTTRQALAVGWGGS